VGRIAERISDPGTPAIEVTAPHTLMVRESAAAPAAR
jgi:hypothetical protein